VLGAISYAGSHLLSLAYLLLYGRYISDTLSAVRAVRAADALNAGIDLTDKQANQHLLSRLLRRRADILELPVQFVPLSPEKVKRTSAFDGLQALLAIVRERFSSEAIVPRTAAPRVAEGAAVSPKPRRGEGG